MIFKCRSSGEARTLGQAWGFCESNEACLPPFRQVKGSLLLAIKVPGVVGPS